MRGKLISITSYLKKTKDQKLRDLQAKRKVKQYEDVNNSNFTVKQEIRKIHGEINDINSQEAQKNLIFLKQRYYVIGGKSTKYLAYKLRKQQKDNTIYKIENPKTNKIETKLEKIQECFEAFYRNLYSQSSAPEEKDLNIFLNSLDIPSLLDSQIELLLKPITVEEVNASITRLKVGKAVGPDGYNAEWYRNLRLELVPLLQQTFNYILQEGVIHPSWREATMSVIQKKGQRQNKM